MLLELASLLLVVVAADSLGQQQVSAPFSMPIVSSQRGNLLERHRSSNPSYSSHTRPKIALAFANDSTVRLNETFCPARDGHVLGHVEAYVIDEYSAYPPSRFLHYDHEARPAHLGASAVGAPFIIRYELLRVVDVDGNDT